jgi:hypothetical protein
MNAGIKSQKVLDELEVHLSLLLSERQRIMWGMAESSVKIPGYS